MERRSRFQTFDWLNVTLFELSLVKTNNMFLSGLAWYENFGYIGNKGIINVGKWRILQPVIVNSRVKNNYARKYFRDEFNIKATAEILRWNIFLQLYVEPWFSLKSSKFVRYFVSLFLTNLHNSINSGDFTLNIK